MYVVNNPQDHLRLHLESPCETAVVLPDRAFRDSFFVAPMSKHALCGTPFFFNAPFLAEFSPTRVPPLRAVFAAQCGQVGLFGAERLVRGRDGVSGGQAGPLRQARMAGNVGVQADQAARGVFARDPLGYPHAGSGVQVCAPSRADRREDWQGKAVTSPYNTRKARSPRTRTLI